MKYFPLFLLLYFSIALITLPHYGYSWDDQQHLGQGIETYNFLTKGTPFTPFTPEGMPTGAYGLILPMLGFISQNIFTRTLGLLSEDAAFHLVILPIVIIGLISFYLLMKRSTNPKIAFLSVFFLAGMPRFFGHLHQNIKDIPSSCFMALAVYYFYRSFTDSKLGNWLKAGLAFGLGLSIKVNSLQIPLIIISWYLLIQFFDFIHNKSLPKLIEAPRAKARGIFMTDCFNPSEAEKLRIHSRLKNRGFLRRRNKIFTLYFLPFTFSLLIGFFIALILTPSLWADPIDKIISSYKFLKGVWGSNPVLYFGKIYQAGVNVPRHYPLGLLLVTTPVLTLFFAFFGLILSFVNSLKGSKIHLLLLIWFFLPLSKYLLFNTIVYDDIRHFMEVLFPLSAIASLGAYYIFQKIHKYIKNNHITIESRLTGQPFNHLNNYLPFVFCFLLITYYLLPFIRLHPYEMDYFNEAVGGSQKVQEKGLFDVDFWAISTKEAVQWLNNAAPDNTKIYSAYDIAHLVNYYKKPGLLLDWNDYLNADYILLLNRRSYIYPWIADFVKDKKPVYTLTRIKTPLFWIYKTN